MSAAITAVAVMTLLGQVTASTTAADWARRDLAVFGRLGFDFLEAAATTDYETLALSNCSDAESLCLTTKRFVLKLPRDCRAFTDNAGLLRRQQLLVIGQVERPGHWGVREFDYLLQHKHYPSIVYEYNLSAGIVAVSYDPLALAGEKARADIPAAVRAGSDAADRDRAWSWYRRSTLDAFGACRNPVTIYR